LNPTEQARVEQNAEKIAENFCRSLWDDIDSAQKYICHEQQIDDFTEIEARTALQYLYRFLYGTYHKQHEIAFNAVLAESSRTLEAERKKLSRRNKRAAYDLAIIRKKGVTKEKIKAEFKKELRKKGHYRGINKTVALELGISESRVSRAIK